MNRGNRYWNKAKACADAASRLGYPAERMALLQVAGCFTLLADYVAARDGRSWYLVVAKGAPADATQDTPHSLTPTISRSQAG